MRSTVELNVSAVNTIASNALGEVDGLLSTEPLAVPVLRCPTGYGPRLASVHYDALSIGSLHGTKVGPEISLDFIPLDRP
ncbi:hypothetical protein E8A74_49300 [Polyangium fumosum]|uniref:Uncharacterized protein n=2 Tax=Polyangium fumosum TaxID=889272 RepID=A0A4U1IIH7_9BACT|nr:hypothetical protein E8A74_49300 [Polyangium fumosum]